MNDDFTLRTTFDREAARYQRARPSPPKTLMDAMLERGGLKPGARVLEVGCGTGQATRPLAERGLRVQALELGPALADRARAYVSGPNVTVETVAFEDYRADTLFDALVSVQAFHWLEPVAGLAHAASLLRPGSAILLAWHQERSQHTPFYRATDPIYKRYETPLKLNRPTPDDAPERFTEALKVSSQFGGADVFRYAWSQLYDKAQYLELLLTYSNVQALAPSVRECFLTDIAEVIDEYGAQVERFYESVLLSAFKCR